MSKANEDLLANELNDIVDSADETENVVEKKIEYTKTGRIKQPPKPRTEAQIEAFAKARAKWSEMRQESTKSKHEANLKSRELTMHAKKKQANVICEKAQIRYDKAKSKIAPDKMPHINEDKKTEIPEEDKKTEIPEEAPVIIKKTRKKKPVVIVQDESESELESDDPHIIFVKRKAKPKPAEPPPPPTNPFGKPYFYSVGAMS